MAVSAARQRNAVSEGAALGLVMCGREVLPFDKFAVDLAFAGAWRGWHYRSSFPQVTTDLSKGLDGTRVMTRADERKQVWNLYWDTSGRELEIHKRRQWVDCAFDADDVAGSIDGDVPASGWRQLAEEFLRRFDG